MARVELPVNLNDVESGFPLLPPNVYNATVKSGKEDVSKSSGERKLFFVAEILDGEFAGKQFAVNLSLQPKALWKLRQFMEVLGIEIGDGSGVDTDAFVDRRFRAALGHYQTAGEDGRPAKPMTTCEDFMPYVG